MLHVCGALVASSPSARSLRERLQCACRGGGRPAGCRARHEMCTHCSKRTISSFLCGATERAEVWPVLSHGQTRGRTCVLAALASTARPAPCVRMRQRYACQGSLTARGWWAPAGTVAAMAVTHLPYLRLMRQPPLHLTLPSPPRL